MHLGIVRRRTQVDLRLSLLELSPGALSRSSAFTRSDRGGASVGLCAWIGFVPGVAEKSGSCESAGAELAGAEFAGAGAECAEPDGAGLDCAGLDGAGADPLELCPQAATLHANHPTNNQLRINLFYPSVDS